MSLSRSELLIRADALIKEYGDSPAAGKATTYKPFTDTTPVSPYLEDPNKTYGTPVSLTCWWVKDPDHPAYSIAQRELLQAGENQNIDGLIYISETENIARGLLLTENLRNGLFNHLDDDYDILRCKPCAHVHGEPLYWRVTVVRIEGTP